MSTAHSTFENPFYAMLKTNPPPLIGREDVLRQLLRGVTGPSTGAYQIACFRGIGKSAILRFIAHPDGARTHCPHFIQRPYSEEGRLALVYLDCAQYNNKSLADLLLAETLTVPELADFVDIGHDLEPAQRLLRIYSRAELAHRRVVVLLNHFDQLFATIQPAEANQLRPLVQEASFIIASERPLVDLNEPTYASWFGTMALEVNLDPLDPYHARELLHTALHPFFEQAGMASKLEQSRFIAPYLDLLPQTGYHPAYILRGAAVLYELAHDLPQIDTAVFMRITRDRLFLHTFKAEFKRYWTKLLDLPQKQLLGRLVQNKIEPEQDSGRLQLMRYLGLVTWEGGRFQPFSALWADYVRDHLVDLQPPPPDPADSPTAVSLPTLPPTDDLTPRQQQLLQYFQQYPHEICAYEDILQQVWRRPARPKDLRLLRETVRQLRPKLQEMDWGQIINQRGRGYEFQPPM
ncbi:MAG: ATP-binding protein [Anaerolineales bacterium]|nr:ATP-binding protein [Anaerolineales bacterium]